MELNDDTVSAIDMKTQDGTIQGQLATWPRNRSLVSHPTHGVMSSFWGGII